MIGLDWRPTYYTVKVGRKWVGKHFDEKDAVQQRDELVKQGVKAVVHIHPAEYIFRGVDIESLRQVARYAISEGLVAGPEDRGKIYNLESESYEQFN